MSNLAFEPCGIVTFLTDFGLHDTYVGQMKGVALSIDPTLRIVDLTHDVAPQDIVEGAFQVWSCVEAFPPGTVHVAVVDPGVGTDRRAICVEAYGSLFVGPDNGLFEHILGDASNVVEVRNRAVQRSRVSETFHGRDVFAPAGAYLASGRVGSADLGPKASVESLVRLPPVTGSGAGYIAGRIVSIDRFGNCITMLGASSLPAEPQSGLVTCGTFSVDAIDGTFADVDEAEPLAYIGSHGTLEIAVRNGNAAERFSLRRGDWVRVRRPGGQECAAAGQ